MFTWQQLHDHITVNLKDGSINKDEVVEIQLFAEFYQLGRLMRFGGQAYFELEDEDVKRLLNNVPRNEGD